MRVLVRSALTIGCALAAPLACPNIIASACAAQATAPNKDVTIPFELENKQIYLQVTVGPSKSLWFVLDTGDKYAVMDLDLAKSLGLELGDQVLVGGGGKTTIAGNFLKNSPFGVAGLTGFTQPLFIAIPLSDLSKATGRQFAGVLGFDFISQFVVEIDYVRKTITLHDKASYQYHGDGESFPITFNAAAHPQLRAQVIDAGRPPIDGIFVFDLGSGAPLILNKPFVESEHFLASGRPTVPWLEGQGIGGAIAGSVGRIKGLKIGRFLIDNPVTVFSQAESGALASAEAQGNIGAAILEKFKVILDYAKNRIILEPNSQFAEPLEYNRAGLSLVALEPDYKTLKIEKIAENSPASEAGLQPGDILTTINGQPASSYSLYQARLIFKEAKECDLTVKRANDTLQIKLKPRRLI